jgi:hypothetical protein
MFNCVQKMFGIGHLILRRAPKSFKNNYICLGTRIVFYCYGKCAY